MRLTWLALRFSATDQGGCGMFSYRYFFFTKTFKNMKSSNNKQRIFCWLMKGLMLPLFLALSAVSFADIFPTSKQGALQRKITLSVDNEKVKQVLNKIEATGSVRFVYQPQVVNTARAVSLAVEEMPIGHVLNMLFDGGAAYEEMGDLVVIKPMSRNVAVLVSVS